MNIFLTKCLHPHYWPICNVVTIWHILMVSCQKGPTRHVNAWQIGPFWQDTLNTILPSFYHIYHYYCDQHNSDAAGFSQNPFSLSHGNFVSLVQQVYFIGLYHGIEDIFISPSPFWWVKQMGLMKNDKLPNYSNLNSHVVQLKKN